MMRGISVRWRMTIWYGGVLATMLLVFGVAIYFVMRQHLLDRIDTGLREELSDVLSEVTRANDRDEMLVWLDRRFARHEGFDFQITGADGERVFANLRMNERRLPIPQSATAGDAPTFSSIFESSESRYRIVTQQVDGPGAPLIVQVARSLQDFDHETSQLLATLLVAGPLTLLCAIGGGYFLARRALSPVDRMAAAATEIDARRLGRRLAVVNSDDEIGHLASTLNHMLDRLENSFQEMHRFTADASHELRTPISVIRSEAELALGKPLTESERQDLLGSILEECERLSWVTDQLLTLCREDAGITSMTREQVDLVQLVSGVVETMRPLAEGKNQKLTARTDGPAILEGDPVRLRHVVYNLLDNAIKYTPSGGEVSTTVTTVGQEIQLCVEDNGIGIPHEHVPHVFERFYRVDKSRSRAAGGTGLGLSIVQSIVAAHGGGVEVSSVPDRGTLFRIRIPSLIPDNSERSRRVVAFDTRVIPVGSMDHETEIVPDGRVRSGVVRG